MQFPSRSGPWAIVLAGGEGTRVRTFLQQLCGGRGIKQFCAVIGRRSMLEHTLARIERRIPRERIVVVVSRDHGDETARQLAHWPVENVIVQPHNRDTAPGILLPLAYISQRDPEATVAIFPSDHFIVAEERFMATVEVAVGETQRFPGNLTLLGVTPEEDEDGYGWIEPAEKDGGRQTYAVREFWEKPSPVQRRTLLAREAVWNTFVCVGHASTLWEMIHHTAPALSEDFFTIRHALGHPRATAVIDAVYTQMRPVNFSTAVCEQLPGKLRVLPMPNIGWSDWGSKERIFSTLQRLGKADEVLARLQRHGDKATLPTPRQATQQRGPSILG